MAGILQRGICTPGIWPDGLTDFRVLQDDDLPRLKAEDVGARRAASRIVCMSSSLIFLSLSHAFVA